MIDFSQLEVIFDLLLAISGAHCLRQIPAGSLIDKDL